MRTRSALSYEPFYEVTKKNKTRRKRTSNEGAGKWADNDNISGDAHMQPQQSNGNNVLRRNEDNNIAQTTEVPTVIKDRFQVNGEILINPLVIVSDIGGDTNGNESKPRTPRRQKKLFSTSPWHVLRSGRAVGARQSGTLCLNKSGAVLSRKKTPTTRHKKNVDTKEKADEAEDENEENEKIKGLLLNEHTMELRCRTIRKELTISKYRSRQFRQLAASKAVNGDTKDEDGDTCKWSTLPHQMKSNVGVGETPVLSKRTRNAATSLDILPTRNSTNFRKSNKKNQHPISDSDPNDTNDKMDVDNQANSSIAVEVESEDDANQRQSLNAPKREDAKNLVGDIHKWSTLPKSKSKRNVETPVLSKRTHNTANYLDILPTHRRRNNKHLALNSRPDEADVNKSIEVVTTEVPDYQPISDPQLSEEEFCVEVITNRKQLDKTIILDDEESSELMDEEPPQECDATVVRTENEARSDSEEDRMHTTDRMDEDTRRPDKNTGKELEGASAEATLTTTMTSFVDDSTYHTAMQSALFANGDSTLQEEELTRVEEEIHDTSNNVREAESDVEFRKRFLSEDYSILSRKQPNDDRLEPPKKLRRSFGIQRVDQEVQTELTTIEKKCIGTQTDDAELIPTSKFRCPTLPSRQSHGQSAACDLENASFFTTDTEDNRIAAAATTAKQFTTAASNTAIGNDKKSDESIDRSLLRSLLNTTYTKNKSADLKEQSKWSSRFYSENSVPGSVASTHSLSSDVFTNSTLSSISHHILHDTVFEEEDEEFGYTHFYDDYKERREMLDLNSTFMTSASHEFDSALHSFVLEPMPGLKRNGKPVRNLRRHLKYFPPPVYQSSTRNSPRFENSGEYISVLSSVSEANIAICPSNSSFSQEMEENFSRDFTKHLLTYSRTSTSNDKKNVVKCDNCLQHNRNQVKKSSHDDVLNQLNGAISALDSLISDNEAFEKRFESFEQMAREKAKSVESVSAASSAVTTPSPKVTDPKNEEEQEKENRGKDEYDFVDPLRGGLYKLKALIGEFEKIIPSSTPLHVVREHNKQRQREEEAKAASEKKLVDVAVGTDSFVDWEGKDKKNEAEEKTESREDVVAANNAIVDSPAVAGNMVTPSRMRHIHSKRDVAVGKNRRSGLLTPLTFDKNEDVAVKAMGKRDDAVSATATTTPLPRSARELFSRLNIRTPFDQHETDEEDEEDSEEFIDAIVRSRNAFTPLPGPTVRCRLCGLELPNKQARNLHIVRRHIDELAKGVGESTHHNGASQQTTTERRAVSVDSGHVSSALGNPSSNTISENEELSFVENGEETREQKTPQPTPNEFVSLNVPRRRLPSRRLFQLSIDEEDEEEEREDTEMKQQQQKESSSGVETSASGYPPSPVSPETAATQPSLPSSTESSKSSWVRWANLTDSDGVRNQNRYKKFGQIFDDSSRRISFDMFCKENDSPVGASVESCGASVTSSIEYQAYVTANDTTAKGEASKRSVGGGDFTQTAGDDYHEDTTLMSALNKTAERSSMKKTKSDKMSGFATSTPCSQAGGDGSGYGGPLTPSVTPLARLAPTLVTPENNPKESSSVTTAEKTSASLVDGGIDNQCVTPELSSADRSDLDWRFDISSRIERFNGSTTAQQTPSNADGQPEEQMSKKQRRRTGYDQKTTPSVREMVSMIHNNGFMSTSQLMKPQRKPKECHDDYGTPLTHGLILKARGRDHIISPDSSPTKSRKETFWRVHNFYNPISGENFLHALPRNNTKPFHAGDTSIRPDGWRFLASFALAARALENRKRQVGERRQNA